jgi:hypothetical protein
VSETLWFNAIWFQSIWFATVLGQSAFLPLAVGLLLVHLLLTVDRRTEMLQMAAVGGLGIVVDAVLSATGVYQFPDGVLVPLWLMCLWFGFAAVLARSLAYLGTRPLFAALAGAIAFPLNYWAGQRLGAVEFAHSLTLTLPIIAACWVIALPLMFRMTRLLLPRERAEEGA